MTSKDLDALAPRQPETVPTGKDESWFTERLFGVAGYSLRLKRTLHSERSAYQQIDVHESVHHGRLLVLDGCVMLTELDEFTYHEMLAHVGASTLARLERAVVVGGGDGGIVRELLKYPDVSITQAEIDERVVRLSQEFLPEVSAGLSDPRVTLVFQDGAEFLAGVEPGSLDLVVVDSTDPVGPAEALITEAFFAQVAETLGPDGVLVSQALSAFYHPREIRQIYSTLGRVFPSVWMFWAVCPSYLGSLWTFCYASRTRHPLDHLAAKEGLATRYYSPDVHRAAFALPPFVQACLPPGHPQRASE